MRNVETDEKRSLWNRILGLLEEDLAQRRRARVFVRVRKTSRPQDLPALVEAERYKAEEHEKWREREEFVREVQEDLERLQLIA